MKKNHKKKKNPSNYLKIKYLIKIMNNLMKYKN